MGRKMLLRPGRTRPELQTAAKNDNHDGTMTGELAECARSFTFYRIMISCPHVMFVTCSSGTNG